MEKHQELGVEEEHYEPLLPPSERVPSFSTNPGAAAGTTILVAIPADMQAGDVIPTHTLLRQRSFHVDMTPPQQQQQNQQQQSSSATALDLSRTATGIPVEGGAPGGHLVFLADLPSTVQLWHSQRLLMVVWLCSSLISLVLFAPLFMASGAFLAAEIAAVMGVIASVVALCERELASSNTMELGAQLKLVATCGIVACFLDGFTIVLDMLLLWNMACDPADDICMSVSKYAFVFAINLVHHGSLSYLVSTRANSIMPLLNPVSSGAVRL